MMQRLATPRESRPAQRLRCERGVSFVETLTILPMLAVVLLGIYALVTWERRASRRPAAASAG